MILPSTIDAGTRDLLALNLVPGLGPRLTRALLERFGSATAVRSASAQQLATIRHIGDKLSRDLAEAMKGIDVDKELQLLEKHQVGLLKLDGDEYPERLKSIGDAPQLLYIRGDWSPMDSNAIAIVGSRHCTNSGRRIAERLAGDLVRAGFTIISGLARGIDAASHRGALAAGGRTIAVLAGGLSSIYPPEHADLAEEIVAAGALLSESPMSFLPMAGMFPARNRLISGLSRGVVVVEAAAKSGALITASLAAEQGREVFAVPGSLDNPASAGTLSLIKKGAVLVRHVEDILNEFGEPPARRTADSKPLPTNLTEAQKQVIEVIGGEPVHADEIVQKSRLTVAEVGNALMMMEMQGIVRRLPGNRFERK